MTYYCILYNKLLIQIKVNVTSHVTVTNCYTYVTCHITQPQVIVTQLYIIEVYKRFQNNNVILYIL